MEHDVGGADFLVYYVNVYLIVLSLLEAHLLHFQDLVISDAGEREKETD